MDSEVLQLLALKQRDRAFEKLLEMYETKVFRLVMSMLHDAARAEEVCQDVFLKIWQSLEVYDPKRSAPGTWIYRVAQNTALTHLRNEAYRRTLPLNAIEEPCSAAASGGRMISGAMSTVCRRIFVAWWSCIITRRGQWTRLPRCWNCRPEPSRATCRGHAGC